jgi:hypothetical protein
MGKSLIEVTNSLTVSVLILLALGLLWVAADYGTMRPCGVLREELVREAASDHVDALWRDDISLLELAGMAVGASTLDSLVEMQIAGRGMRPHHCATAMWRWRVKGEAMPILSSQDQGSTQRDAWPNDMMPATPEELAQPPVPPD